MSTTPRRVHVDGAPMWLHRGRLIPVLAGGDTDGLYPVVPDDLASLSRAELDALRQEIARIAAIATDVNADGRGDLVGELPMTDVVAQTAAALDAVDRIETRITEIDTAEQEQAEALEALSTRAAAISGDAEADAEPDAEQEDAEAAGDGDDGDEPDAAPEVEAEQEDAEVEAGEPVAVAASASPAEIADAIIAAAARRAPRRRARVPARNDGREQSMSLVASGERIESLPELATVMSERLNNFVGRNVSSDERVTVARIQTDYPEDRHIGGGREATEGILSRVFSRANLTGPQALTAAGGICAPPVPLYDVETFAVDERPVAAGRT